MSTQPSNEAPKMKLPKFNIFWLYAIIFAVLVGLYMVNNDSYTKQVSWTEFERYVTEGGVSDIIVISNKGVAEGVLTDSVAQKIFPDYQKSTSSQARIVAEAASADKIQDKIDEWGKEGIFNGNVK